MWFLIQRISKLQVVYVWDWNRKGPKPNKVVGNHGNLGVSTQSLIHLFVSVSFLFFYRRNREQHIASTNSKMVRTRMEIFDGELLGFRSSREAIILRNLSKAEEYGWCPNYKIMLDLQPVCLPTLYSSNYWAQKWNKKSRFCFL